MDEKKITVQKAQDVMRVKIVAEDIRKYFCPLATEKEVFMALGIIKSLNLNPFTREVHLIKYSSEHPISIVVGYETYLKRAERTKKLDGWEVGITEDGLKAWAKIYRKDWKTPFYWEVTLSEFNKNQSTWNQIPNFMGKKVAIAQAFRLAFPDEIGGMPYTQEEHEIYDVANLVGKPNVEMPKAISDLPPTQPEEQVQQQAESTQTETKPITEGQIKALHSIANQLKVKGMDGETYLHQYLFEKYEVNSTKDLTIKQARQAIEELLKKIDSQKKNGTNTRTK